MQIRQLWKLLRIPGWNLWNLLGILFHARGFLYLMFLTLWIRIRWLINMYFLWRYEYMYIMYWRIYIKNRWRFKINLLTMPYHWWLCYLWEQCLYFLSRRLLFNRWRILLSLFNLPWRMWNLWQYVWMQIMPWCRLYNGWWISMHV